jgi:hypothetical protein
MVIVPSAACDTAGRVAAATTVSAAMLESANFISIPLVLVEKKGLQRQVARLA